MKIYSLLFLLSASLLFACSAKSDSAQEKVASRDVQDYSLVKLAPVLEDSSAESISSIGVVINKTQAKPSFKTGGIVDKTFFNEGDQVKSGQLLATLLLDEINAQVQQAREGLMKAERDLERAQNLHADSVATLEQVQNASTGVEVARKNVEIAEFNRKYSEVRAPISGKVINQLLHEGEVAGPGMPVAVLMGMSSQDWRVKTGLVDAEWSQVKKGDLTSIRLDAFPDQKFEAVVSDKSVMVSDNSGTLDLELQFRQIPPALAAGMICKVEIPGVNQSANTTIPIDALVNTNGEKAIVYTIKDGKAVSVPVMINQILGDKVIVRDGLEGIDSVVTIGAVYLEEGDMVRVASH